jgi:hypothetical protein
MPFFMGMSEALGGDTSDRLTRHHEFSLSIFYSHCVKNHSMVIWFLDFVGYGPLKPIAYG